MGYNKYYSIRFRYMDYYYKYMLDVRRLRGLLGRNHHSMKHNAVDMCRRPRNIRYTYGVCQQLLFRFAVAG